MKFGKLICLVGILASAVARAEITFVPPSASLCRVVTLYAGTPDEVAARFLTAIETPRLHLDYNASEGETPFGFKVYDKVTGKDLGLISLSGYGLEDMAPWLFPGDRAAQENVVQMPIHLDENAGNGRGTEAKYAVMRFAFEKGGYSGIADAIRHDNPASIALHKKLGFRLLSKTAEWGFYGITKEEFEAVKVKFGKEEEKDFLPRTR